MASITTINGTDIISDSRTTINTNFANLNTALEVGNSEINTLTFNVEPIFDVSLGQIQHLTLTGNVTSSTCINLSTPQIAIFIIQQDDTGGRTFVWPANIFGGMTINSTAGAASSQAFVSPDGANFYALSAGAVSLV
jgi:hypothetical protein